MTSNGYDFIRFFGRNIAAIPSGDHSLYLEFIERLNKNSWKKRAFKALLFTIAHLRLKQLVSVHVEEIFLGQRGFSSHDLVTRLEKQLGLSQLKALFFYPPQIFRGRCYAYVFNDNGACVSFVKVSLDSYNTECLINEQRALSIMKGANVSFQVPTIICAEFGDDWSYIAYTPMDKGYDNRHLRWDGVPFQYRNEILGLVRPKKLDECGWWRSLNTIGPQRPDRFLSSFTIGQSDTIFTGNAHGDLTENNIYFKGNELFVIDWEYFSESAPYTVDEISFYLAKYQSLISSDPYLGFKHVITSLCDGYSQELLPERIINAKMALGYLHTMGNSQSIKVTTAWSEQFEDFLNGI